MIAVVTGRKMRAMIAAVTGTITVGSVRIYYRIYYGTDGTGSRATVTGSSLDILARTFVPVSDETAGLIDLLHESIVEDRSGGRLGLFTGRIPIPPELRARGAVPESPRPLVAIRPRQRVRPTRKSYRGLRARPGARGILRRKGEPDGEEEEEGQGMLMFGGARARVFSRSFRAPSMPLLGRANAEAKQEATRASRDRDGARGTRDT